MTDIEGKHGNIRKHPDTDRMLLEIIAARKIIRPATTETQTGIVADLVYMAYQREVVGKKK